MEFSDINGIPAVRITPDDLRRITVRSTSASEYRLNRNFSFGDIVITEDGTSYCNRDGNLVMFDSSQLYVTPPTSINLDEWNRTYLGRINGSSIYRRKNFADRIREVYGRTIHEDNELYDEHGGILDEFLGAFSKKKECE